MPETYYIAKEDLLGKISLSLLTDACDDDKDGVLTGAGDVAVVDQILSDAQDAVDAYLENRYDTPIADPPALLRQAATYFALRDVYARRQLHGKDFPYLEQLEQCIEALEAIRDGAPLAGQSSATPGAKITECASIDQSMS